MEYLKKLRVAELLKKSLLFVEPDSSSPCSQEPAMSCPCVEPDKYAVSSHC
jgi:hypothetical protein